MSTIKPEQVPTTESPIKVMQFITGPLLSNLPFPGAKALSQALSYLFGSGRPGVEKELIQKLDRVLDVIKGLESSMLEQTHIISLQDGRSKLRDESVEIQRWWDVMNSVLQGEQRVTADKLSKTLGAIGDEGSSGLSARLERLHYTLMPTKLDPPPILNERGEIVGAPLLEAARLLGHGRLVALDRYFKYNATTHHDELNGWLEFAKSIMARGAGLLVMHQGFRLVQARTEAIKHPGTNQPDPAFNSLQTEVAQAIRDCVDEYDSRVQQYEDALFGPLENLSAYHLLLRLAEPGYGGKGPILLVLNEFQTKSRLCLAAVDTQGWPLVKDPCTKNPTFRQRFSLRLEKDGTWRLIGSRFDAHPDAPRKATIQASEDNSRWGLCLDHDVQIKVVPEVDQAGEADPCVTLVFVNKDEKLGKVHGKYLIAAPSDLCPHPYVSDMSFGNTKDDNKHPIQLQSWFRPPELRLPLTLGNHTRDVIFVVHGVRVWTDCTSYYRSGKATSAIATVDRAVWPTNSTGCINLYSTNASLGSYETYKVQAVIQLRGYRLSPPQHNNSAADPATVASCLARDPDSGCLVFPHAEAMADVFIKIWLPGAASGNNCIAVWPCVPGKYDLNDDQVDDLGVYEGSGEFASPLDSDWQRGYEGATWEAHGQGLNIKFGMNNEWAPKARARLDIY